MRPCGRNGTGRPKSAQGRQHHLAGDVAALDQAVGVGRILEGEGRPIMDRPTVVDADVVSIES